MQVHIHPLVTIYINTLLAWAKCFLATYGVYPGLYDLLDTPRRDFLASELHLHDSTLPRPLLHRSRGPPTIRSEYVALQPHLASSPPPNCLYVCRTTCPSFNMSVCHATSLSVNPPAPTVCLSTCKSVALSIHPTVSPSVIPSIRPMHSPSTLLSVLRTVHQTIRHQPTICTPSHHDHQAVLHHLTVHPPSTPIRQPICHRHTICTTQQSVRLHVRHQVTV